MELLTPADVSIRVGGTVRTCDEIKQIFVRGGTSTDLFPAGYYVVLDWAERGHSPETVCFGVGSARATQLMDDLWQCGIRPTGGQTPEPTTELDSASDEMALCAMHNHITDLKQIVFELMKRVQNIN
jgi:hypothetical protein